MIKQHIISQIIVKHDNYTAYPHYIHGIIKSHKISQLSLMHDENHMAYPHYPQYMMKTTKYPDYFQQHSVPSTV